MARVYLPPRFALDVKIQHSRVRQLARPAFLGDALVREVRRGRATDRTIETPDGRVTWVVQSAPPRADDDAEVLRVPRGPLLEGADDHRVAQARWLAPSAVAVFDDVRSGEQRRRARASWDGQFTAREEGRSPDGRHVPGLRAPQLGALWGTRAHWTVSGDVGTVVMPTGTGKTETMLALLAAVRPECLLVVVPTDALREQLAGKFLSFGVLQQFGVVGAGAELPVVGILRHQPKTADEVAAFFEACNVVVTTMAVAGGCPDATQAAMAQSASHLFIDEAHHIAAPTWERFRRYFVECDRRVVQFTATPFRGDGRHVDGKVIYSYPLKKAQAEGYFEPVRFRHVTEFDLDRADERIAETAIRQLEEDLAAGRDHLLMARAPSIARATELHVLYARLAPAHQPTLIHSRLSGRARAEALRRLWARETRLVVCVDMLGEGFDMPELKIAALHDLHQSLAVTLQFTGRFTRSRPDLGNATVVANVADDRVSEALRELYAEDADWNVMLRHLSEGATGRQVRHAEFLAAFDQPPPEVPLQNVLPKMSTAMFRTAARTWWPEAATSVIKKGTLYGGLAINHRDRVLVFITREQRPVSWGDVRELRDTVWHLHLAHWDAEQGLLFVHSSDTGSLHEGLARAIGGSSAELIRGEPVFRCFHDVHRLLLINLGLSHAVDRRVRFTMHVGDDVRAGLAEAQKGDKRKTNFFGRGFERGAKASIGCSYKGRVWAHQIAPDIPSWVAWCKNVGAKLLDETIDTNAVLQQALIPERVADRPAAVPLVIEWPEELTGRSEDVVRFDIAGDCVTLTDVGLELTSHEETGPLRFRVNTERASAEYEIVFVGDAVEYRATGPAAVEISVSGRRQSLTEYLRQEPPIVRFHDHSFLVFNELFRPALGGRRPFPRERVDAWTWDGVTLTKESQGLARAADSIQHRVIRTLKAASPTYDVVMDDDAAYEAADVVALRVDGEVLHIDLFHCTYAFGKPGQRVTDLYEVCGQAQRSVSWKGDAEHLIDHFLRRDAKRVRAHGEAGTRFEVGDARRLRALKRRLRVLRVEMRVTVVQPGASKAGLTSDQLELLAATELYLKTTYGVDFSVVVSA